MRIIPGAKTLDLFGFLIHPLSRRGRSGRGSLSGSLEDTKMGKRLFLQAGVLCGLIILLTACASGGSGTQRQPTTVPTASAGAASPIVSPSPGISLGPQTCPVAVQDPAHWEPIIPTQPGTTKVQSVTCGYLKGVPSLQALVTVLHSDTSKTLDVYVYDNLTGATPNQIFKLENLAMGTAKISGYNSVLTAEADLATKQTDNATQLCREFKWSDGTGTLVQVAFPGIFPDLTRFQAEEDQAQVNQGHQPWKLSATKTAQALGANLWQWDANAPATLVSGGGPHDVQAVVNLKNTGPASMGVTINLSRLEGNTNGGIWIVTDVEANGLSITQPQTGSIIHSSTTVTGTGNAFEAVIGKVSILDYQYATIGQATARGATGNGNTTFTTKVTTQPSFKNGAQEGLVMLTETSNATGGIAGAVIVKVLLQL